MADPEGNEFDVEGGRNPPVLAFDRATPARVRPSAAPDAITGHTVAVWQPSQAGADGGACTRRRPPGGLGCHALARAAHPPIARGAAARTGQPPAGLLPRRSRELNPCPPSRR